MKRSSRKTACPWNWLQPEFPEAIIVGDKTDSLFRGRVTIDPALYHDADRLVGFIGMLIYQLFQLPALLLGGIRSDPVTLRIDLRAKNIDLVTEAVLTPIAKRLLGGAGRQGEGQQQCTMGQVFQ